MSVRKDHRKNRVVLCKQLVREGFTHVTFYRPYCRKSEEYIFFFSAASTKRDKKFGRLLETTAKIKQDP